MKLIRVVLIIIILLVPVQYATAQVEENPGEVDTINAYRDSVDNAQEMVFAEIQSGFEILRPIFVRGCFDCHSTQTVYPWYHKIPVIKGMIDHDVKEGREELDMTDGFPFAGKLDPVHALEEIAEVLEEGEMPPMKYRILHWNAKPSDAEVDSIMAWVETSLMLIPVHQDVNVDREDDD